MPSSGVVQLERALELGGIVHFDEHRHARARVRARLELAHAARISSAAAISRMQSAPIARAS